MTYLTTIILFGIGGFFVGCIVAVYIVWYFSGYMDKPKNYEFKNDTKIEVK